MPAVGPLPQKELHRLLARLDQEDTFVFLETTRVTATEHRSWLFMKPLDRILFTAGDSPRCFFDKAQKALARGHYLAGWLAYEFGTLLEPVLARQCNLAPGTVLADLGVYPLPHIFDHLTTTFSGAGPWPTCPPADGENPPDNLISNLRLNEGQEKYLKSIRRIKKYIESGDTYQVNYTLKHLFDFQGSAEALYTALRRSQSVSYAAFIRQNSRSILSFSPELFFRRQGDICTVRPMKGTMQRGTTPAEDARLAAFLHNDTKNRSENIMIVDLLRNDLGRLSQAGQVKTADLFTVETYETVHQMTSSIQCRLRNDVGLEEFFGALFPSGSVTGAPKIRTMEIIHELESSPRGVYTGGIGFLAPNGDGVFNVPIRTVSIENGRGEMGIGSGVVYDSDPIAEWEECRLKGSFLADPLPEFQLIETMLWQPGTGFWLLEEHLERLRASAAHLGFAMDQDAVSERLAEEKETLRTDLVDESSGQRVRFLLSKDGNIEVTSVPCPLPDLTEPPSIHVGSNETVKVRLAPMAQDSTSLYLFHKTTQRHQYDREREEAARHGFFEVLFNNERGEITEGSFTNIFVQKGSLLATPPVACGLLDGVFRRYLLDTFPDKVREEILTPADLQAADALYVGNSVRGLVLVRLVTE